MPSNRVSANLNSGTYFLTLTIQRWYYLLSAICLSDGILTQCTILVAGDYARDGLNVKGRGCKPRPAADLDFVR